MIAIDANTPFTTGATFDPVTGLPLTTTDVNGQVTTIEYNDPLLRPTKVIAPHGQQTLTEYGAGTSAATRYVKSRTQIDATNWKEGSAWYDGLGRTYKTQSIDSNGDVFTETEFDEQGRPKRATNPYRSGETKVWTTTNYDAAGRAFEVVMADGAQVTTSYGLATSGANIGTFVTVTDQALKQRRSITNALGQLTRVDEPNDAGSLGDIASPTQPTFYSYDTLNNLITVNQGGQVRSFAYDSLSRLKQATNPESGLISYAYDNNGNLTSKIDARSITTSYGYDNLNRVLTRTYSGEAGYTTPAVSYFYDNLTNAKGKLTKVMTAATATNAVTETRYLAFDILGRVTSSQQMTDGVTYNPQSYVYNLSGALLEEIYPSGRIVKNTLDTDGDLQQVQSAKANGTLQNYANSFNYTAAGAVSAMRLGNGKWENTQFNSRLQPVQIGLGGSATSQNLLKLNYEYGATASVNNGNITKQTISVPPETRNNVTYAAFTATQNYTYDALNRLKDAKEMIGATQEWKQTFQYDRYGNRRFDEANTTTLAPGCQTAVCNPTIDAATNKLSGYQFDSSGNTKVDAGGQTFVYDAENKQVQVSNSSGIVGQYFYDGDGKRIKKYVPSSGETTIFVYDASGKMVAEYSTVTASAQDAKISYLTNDTLGSPRITTDQNGAAISRRDFMPFGEEISRAGYGTDAVRQKFTGYERDTESDLDFAQARMYANKLGRFTTADPIYIEAKRLTDPQQFNLYGYVRNNPLKFVDVTGKYLILANANARAAFRQVSTNGLTKAERQNIRILANGKVVLRSPNAINAQNSSSAYQQLTNVITDKNLTIKVYSVAKGQNINGVYFQGVYNSHGLTMGKVGDATREVYIPVGGATVAEGNPPGSGNKVPSPEDAIFAHEVFGHATGNDVPYSITNSNGTTRNGDGAIDAENEYRRNRNPALGERSGEDHHTIDTVKGEYDTITTAPANIQTTISPRPLEPLPPPKKPGEN